MSRPVHPGDSGEIARRLADGDAASFERVACALRTRQGIPVADSGEMVVAALRALSSATLLPERERARRISHILAVCHVPPDRLVQLSEVARDCCPGVKNAVAKVLPGDLRRQLYAGTPVPMPAPVATMSSEV